MNAIREHDVTVLLGDVREQLATLTDESVQCVVTSPPYYGLRDYGCDGQLGLEASPGEYVETMRAVFADVRRVLADDGVLWLNLGDSYSGGNRGAYDTVGHLAEGVPVARPVTGVPAKNLMGIPWRVAFALQDDGWILRNAVIWNKPNAMPESVTDRLSTRYEHVFLFSKSRRYWFDLDAVRVPTTTEHSSTASSAWRDGALGHAGATSILHNGWRPGDSPKGRNPGDVWDIATSPTAVAHFATMPQALARRCILAGCKPGGTVLDVFAGSGTTLKVARSLGHKSVGIELNPDYIPIIRDRIGPETLDFGAAS